RRAARRDAPHLPARALLDAALQAGFILVAVVQTAMTARRRPPQPGFILVAVVQTATTATCLKAGCDTGARRLRRLVVVAADAAEGALELGRDDPDLVRLALCDERQRLHVLIGQQLRVGVALVNGPEHGVDRLRLALRLQDLRLALALRAKDRGLLLALRGEDRRLLLALGLQDRRALLAVGPHLLLHRVLDRRRRVDRLQLHAVDADPPLAGRLVEDAAQLRVDLVARRQRPLERETADHVAESRH